MKGNYGKVILYWVGLYISVVASICVIINCEKGKAWQLKN